jgi:signal transduction histidine kinase
VSAFCKEFTVQQGIQVTFNHENVASALPSEVSLCLFRIIQEGLRNIKKHSGAANARVTLETADGCLHLSVADDGVGFDVTNHGSKEGLGVRSMEERARLIGARFEIRSKPQKGTRIDVWMRPAPQKCKGALNKAVVPSTVSAG